MKGDKVSVPGCRGTTVRELHNTGGLQVMLVEVEPGGEIPVHKHDCAATMVIVEGAAQALGTTPRCVKKGDVVVKVPLEPHGFSDIVSPFSFISISDGKGIKCEDGWDMCYE